MIIRIPTLIAALCMAGAVAYTFEVAREVQGLERRLRAIHAEIEEVRVETQTLRAEWARLNDLDRLRSLAERHLPDLVPMQAAQFQRHEEAMRRLPPAIVFAGPAGAFAPRAEDAGPLPVDGAPAPALAALAPAPAAPTPPAGTARTEAARPAAAPGQAAAVSAPAQAASPSSPALRAEPTRTDPPPARPAPRPAPESATLLAGAARP
ncbi:MAG: hypothetical protein NZN45_11755, partial [Rhodovarius sp.]|nr:hypothetical protein [Rhodovarius sp.]